jgi:hypothetical protein
MTYRDELEAAVHRANESERSLADERARSAQKDREIYALQAQLAQAQSQIARWVPPEARGEVAQWTAPIGNVLPAVRVGQIALWTATALALVAVALAGSGSETAGVIMAKTLCAVPGAAIGGHLSRRRPIGRYLLGALFGAVALRVLVEFFFVSLWPAL